MKFFMPEDLGEWKQIRKFARNKIPLNMGQNELYILIAVFVILTVVIVWIGAKSVSDIRKQKKRRENRRQEWQSKISTQRKSNG